MLSTDLTMVEKASKNVPSILDKKKRKLISIEP